jgi:hypothetical protein
LGLLFTWDEYLGFYLFGNLEDFFYSFLLAEGFWVGELVDFCEEDGVGCEEFLMDWIFKIYCID